MNQALCLFCSWTRNTYRVGKHKRKLVAIHGKAVNEPCGACKAWLKFGKRKGNTR
jgi:hypothetical protein